MTSLDVMYAAMVTAVENDDVKSLKHLLQTGADVNANLDDDIGKHYKRFTYITYANILIISNRPEKKL